MKRTIFSLFACVGILFSMANPIYMPEVYLKDFSFDENLEWTMSFYCMIQPDSISIANAQSSLTYIPKAELNNEFGLTIDSLDSALLLNPEGDSLTVIYHFKHGSHMPDSLVEIVVYGNYRGATLPSPKPGQSITRILENQMGTNYHSLKSSTGSLYGKLSGKIYNKNNQPITSGSFSVDPFPVMLSCGDGGFFIHGTDVGVDGGYSSNFYAMVYNLNTVALCTKYRMSENCNYYSEKEVIPIKPLLFTVFPDSTIQMDIYLLEDYVGINTLKQVNPDVFKIFPNPVGDEFRFEVAVPVKSTNCSFSIVSLSGQQILNLPVIESRGLLSLPSSIKNGNYIIQLWMNGKAYHSKQFSVVR